MTASLRHRLSFMMFMEYLASGFVVPMLSLYLRKFLCFEPYQVGQVLAAVAVAALFAPLAASRVADRYVSSEHLLAVCHAVAGVTMVVLALQRSYLAFLVIYFIYGLAFTPTYGLTNTVALHHMTDAKRDFGGVRMWGTASWVLAAWAFSFLWLRGGTEARLPHLLYASALASLLLAAYALTLPRPGPRCTERVRASYRAALQLLRRPDLFALCGLTFLSSMGHQLYYYGMSPFLSQAGFPDHYIMPAMSIGQVTEVFVLGALGLCLTRLTLKQVMLLGLLAQALRYGLFAYGGPLGLIIAGIGLHGFCYAFLFTSAYLYVDQHSSDETRAGAQQILTIMIAGFGTLAGFLAGGYLAQAVATQGEVNFRLFWSVACAFQLGLAVAMALLFNERAVESGS